MFMYDNRDATQCDYRCGGHSKYSLTVHLIFVVKYRKKILSYNISEDIKQYMYDISNKYGYRILQMETDKDHIHILLSYSSSDSISDIVRHLKQHSTYYIWRKYRPYLSKHFWKRNIFWSEGYFACSIGQASQKTIERYIQNQG